MSAREPQGASPYPSPLKTALDLYPLKVIPAMPLLQVITLMSQGCNSSASVSQNSESDSEQPEIRRSSYALVMVEEQLVGILTERDVVKLITQEINLTATPVAEVMTQQLITLSESDLQDPFAALGIFRQHHIRHLPVLNEQKQVVGVVTPSGIRQTLQPSDLFRLRRIEEMMSTHVIDAAPEATVLDLAKLMATHRVSCVVITRQSVSPMVSGLRPIGIVTERDIVQFQALGLNLGALQAQTVMSTPLVCLNPKDSLWTANQTMQRMRVRRLVVTNDQGNLAGIVTQTSILAALDPLEMQKTIVLLEQQVEQLKDERMQWLRNQASHLENQVQMTEQRYANLAEAAPVGIFRTDAVGDCVYVNERWCQIAGISLEAARGVGWVNTIHPEDRETVATEWYGAAQAQRPFHSEYRFQTPTGRVTWVFGKAVAEMTSDGCVSGYIGTIMDITARKQIEEALQYQLAQAQLVTQISTRFSNLASADLDTGIQQTLQEIAAFTHMDVSSMVQFSPTDQVLKIAHAQIAIELQPQYPQIQQLPASALPWMTAQTQQDAVICVPDVADLPTEAATDQIYWQALKIRALVAVPIRYQNDVMGWIGCASKLAHVSSAAASGQMTGCFFQAVELLKLVGEIFAHALQRRNTEAELYQYQHHLEDLIASRTAELQESEFRFRTMADTAPVLIWMSGGDQLCTYFNQGWLEFTGRTIEQEVGNGWLEGIHPEDLKPYRDTAVVAFEACQAFQIEYRLRRFDGVYRWMLSAGSPRFLPSGELAGFIGSCIDITEHKQMAQELFREKEQAQVTLHSIGDAVITTNALGQVEYFNPVAERLTGWNATSAKGRLLPEVFHIVNETTRELVENPVEHVLREGCITELANHTVLISRQGREYSIEDSAAPIRDRAGHMIGTVMVFHDVTQSRRLAHRLSWQASHDALTGLTNRRQFEQTLIETLKNIQQDASVHVLCYLDLDQFKVVNDTCGHMAGDELLRQISRLLRGQIRATDTLARLGGDEFGILIKQCPVSRARQIAEKLREVIQNFRFLWQENVFRIGVSIGLVSLDDSHTLAEVLSAADAACYAAKNRGRNRVHVYQVDDLELAKQRSERQWSVRIRQALEDNRFCLYRQAIVPTTLVSEMQQVHYEILLRMVDEQGDLILPGTFMPAAERYDLMPDIDRWVIRTVFEYLERTQQQPTKIPETILDTLHLINLSGTSVGDAQFLNFLKEQFTQYAISPQAIGFEITETVAIANLEQANHFIHEFKQLGCHFALDDFGSGMSSFGYLKTLPVDYLKIDGKFIEDMGDDPATYAIVEAINHVGHVMGLETIAESVENLTLRKKLVEIGVDYVQGYSIALPCPIILS